jgi:hypothetical protein
VVSDRGRGDELRDRAHLPAGDQGPGHQPDLTPGAFSGKVEAGFPSENATNKKAQARLEPRSSRAASDRRPAPRGAFSFGSVPYPRRDAFSSNGHLALGLWWSMIFSENRCTLFGIML